jgi:HPt (histidine-containing phosphotransfer) domain-containing protein
MDDAPLVDKAVTDELIDVLGADGFGAAVEQFVANGAQRLAEIAKAAAARDGAQLRHEIHSLKGAAQTLGASRLAGHAAAAELACREGRIDDALALARGLPGLHAETSRALNQRS